MATFTDLLKGSVNSLHNHFFHVSSPNNRSITSSQLNWLSMGLCFDIGGAFGHQIRKKKERQKRKQFKIYVLNRSHSGYFSYKVPHNGVFTVKGWTSQMNSLDYFRLSYNIIYALALRTSGRFFNLPQFSPSD